MEQQSEHLLKLIEAYTNLVQEEKQIFFEYIYQQQKEQNQQLIINKQLKQQRTNYPIHIKKEVVKISLLHNNSTYAAQYMNKTYPEFHNIFRQNTISDWVKQFSTLQQKAASKKKKQQNRKQQQKYPLLEEKQSCEFQLARQNKLAINTLWFKIHLKKLVNENQVDLKCSQGWLYNFLKRYKIVKRTPTHYIQQKAKDLQQQIEQFLKDCLKHKYDIEKFGQVEGKNKIIYYNMDKTPLYFDMQLKSTYSFKGERQIIVKKTNHPKKRLKILLAINSEGDKLPPLLIFNKQKKQMTDFQMISQYVESKILKFKKIFLSNGLIHTKTSFQQTLIELSTRKV
ncbi:hypothetical protein ABPG72_010885 [Tetrahymena utriculariae]